MHFQAYVRRHGTDQKQMILKDTKISNSFQKTRTKYVQALPTTGRLQLTQLADTAMLATARVYRRRRGVRQRRQQRR